MKIGFVGLGKMGLIMVSTLSKKHSVVAFDLSQQALSAAVKKGAIPSKSLANLASKLPSQKIIWLMVPAGKPVDIVIKELLPSLSKNDILVDGGNSFYKDSVRRYTSLKKKGIHFIDVGTSGGLEGAAGAASLTIGGDKKAFNKLIPIFKTISIKDGYGHVGPSGAGHFVKMVHNGVEYANLQALGEGFELLHRGPYKLNLAQVAGVWSHGSVIRSWLTELAEQAFTKDPELKKIRGVIGGGETGAWTVKTAKKLRVPVKLIETALKLRFATRKKEKWYGKVVAALRNEFGGHEVKKK